jgi:hypothetical protein
MLAYSLIKTSVFFERHLYYLEKAPKGITRDYKRPKGMHKYNSTTEGVNTALKAEALAEGHGSD